GCATVKDAQGNNTRNILCSLGNVNPGDVVSKQIQVRPKGNLNQVTFDASVSNDFTDANPANNTSKVMTPVGSLSHPANDNFLNAFQLSGSGTNQTGTLINGKLDDLKGNIGATREQPINYGIFSSADQIELNHVSQ